MLPSSKRPRLTSEQEFPDPFETQGSVAAQVPTAKEEQEEDTSSISSSSFHFSCPPTSSPSSSSSSSPFTSATLEEEKMPDSGILSNPQSSQSSSSKLDKELASQDVQDKTVVKLARFLLLKYQKKELITKAEILNIVTKECKQQFPVILWKTHELIELIFGITVTKVEPNNHPCFIYNTLDLTYHGMLSADQDMFKTSLLILILSTIFMEGNCLPEEKLWEVLNAVELYAGRCVQFFYRDPRKLITKDWVQKEYLKYQQVPKSERVCYEFLWGPRAHAEINKRNIVQFLVRLRGTNPIAFPAWYKNALKDVEERTQATLDAAGDAMDVTSASSNLSPKHTLWQNFESMFEEAGQDFK